MSDEMTQPPADVRELAGEIIRSLDLIARNYDSYEYGLPVMTHYDEMVDIVVALLRTPRGEGKAVRLLGLAMERAAWLCRDVGRAEWPLSDFGRDMLQARLDTVRDLIGDALAALRSEAPGEESVLSAARLFVQQVRAAGEDRFSDFGVFSAYEGLANAVDAARTTDRSESDGEGEAPDTAR